jgi:uncharacterized membrane protein YGL010W
MKPIERTEADIVFDKYTLSHRKGSNELIHWICIPLIVFGLLGVVWAIPFPHLDFLGKYNGFLNWASFLIAFTLYYYFTLSPVLSFMMLWVVGLMSYGIVQLEYWEATGGPALWLSSLVIFIGAWVGQLIGHKIEGRKSSFLDDVKFLLIGPIWLLHFICKRIGIKY